VVRWWWRNRTQKDSDAGLIQRARGSLGTALVLTLIHSPLMVQNDVLAVIPIELERNKTIIPVSAGS